jgi:hypothetical protein
MNTSQILSNSPFLASVQLFLWLIFQPKLWRETVSQIDPALSPDFALSKLTIAQWQHVGLLRLLGLIYIMAPLFMVVIIGSVLWLFSVEPLLIARCMTYIITLSLVGGIMSGITISVAFSYIAFVIAGLIIGLSYGIENINNWYRVAILAGIFAVSIASSVFLLNLTTIKRHANLISNFLVAGAMLAVVGSMMYLIVQAFGYLANILNNYISLTNLQEILIGLSIGIWLIIGWATRRWYWAFIVAVTFVTTMILLYSILYNYLPDKDTILYILFVPFMAAFLNGTAFSLLFALPYLLTRNLLTTSFFNAQAGIIAGLMGSCGVYVGMFMYRHAETPILSLSIIVLVLGLSPLWWPYFRENTVQQQLSFTILPQIFGKVLQKITQLSNLDLQQFATFLKQRLHSASIQIAATTSDEKIANPYITGVPLTIHNKTLFIGRSDIFARIELLLEGQRSPPILLYGQRRIGKTSLVNFFSARLPKNYVSLFADLQGPITLATNHSGFLYNLGRTLINAARNESQLSLPPLKEKDLHDDPFTAFDEWLDKVEDSMEGHNLLLVLDEFEALENSFARGNLDRQMVLSMFRHIIQHRSRLKIILVGFHQLDVFPEWDSYLINVEAVHLSYLNEAEAIQLIKKPIKDSLQYSKDALKYMLDVTNCHPALLQSLCKEIILQKNLQESNRRGRIHKSDVEAAIPNVLQSAKNYFIHIARRSSIEKKILALLAAQGKNAILSKAQILRHYPQVENSLANLVQCELLESTPTGYRFQVEIIRRWFV